MRGFAAVVIGIALPLAIAASGLDGKGLAIGLWLVTAVAVALLLTTITRVRVALAAVAKVMRKAFPQAFVAASFALSFGFGSALTWGAYPRLATGLLFAAILLVAWWLAVMWKTALQLVSDLAKIHDRDGQARREKLERAIEQLQATVIQLKETAELADPAIYENTRYRAMQQHVINVLLGLELAKQGGGGVSELGVHGWIESNIRASRDVLEEISGRPPGYRIELGVVRTVNGVFKIDMAAGDYVHRLQEHGGCPEVDIEELLEIKARQGGFADSYAVEFPLDGDRHYLIAFATGPLDATDAQLLTLLAAMFLVLKLALGE